MGTLDWHTLCVFFEHIHIYILISRIKNWRLKNASPIMFVNIQKLVVNPNNTQSSYSEQSSQSAPKSPRRTVDIPRLIVAVRSGRPRSRRFNHSYAGSYLRHLFGISACNPGICCSPCTVQSKVVYTNVCNLVASFCLIIYLLTHPPAESNPDFGNVSAPSYD